MNNTVIKEVAQDLLIKEAQVIAVLDMLALGNTVPFIARYRKEATDGLDEDQIRAIQKQYDYEQSLFKRKEDVIRLIEEKGMLSEELKIMILACQKLSEIEDIYRPFKEKKKTKATEAVANGLEPLAKWILSLPSAGDVKIQAQQYLNDVLVSTELAVEGALHIIAENISDEARYRKFIKEKTYLNGVITTKVKKKHEDATKVYDMYYDYSEKINRIVSHRILAINRAEAAKVVSVTLEMPTERLFEYIYRGLTKNKETIVKPLLEAAINDAYKRLIKPSIDREIRSDLSEMAQTQAMHVFSVNVEKLLLQAPLKDKVILGVDPAFRTGCKLAVIDSTGKALMIDKIFPTIGKETSKDEQKVLSLLTQYKVEIIAIGNGTASRETEAFIAAIINKHHLDISYVIVSEAGASVYSASKVAQEEFPTLQVEERSAISIARRIQDPLAELVKIDPKSISVGQYQHDMNQAKLNDQLTFVVSKTVNQVGVNLNTASPSLLSYVSGLSASVAKAIVAYREANGKFESRKELKTVPKLGQKTFEQCAGFLRILEGVHILDQTSIHPESYTITKQLLERMGCTLEDIGQPKLIAAIESVDKSALIGVLGIDHYTLEDILEALMAPQRSPRDHYATPLLKQDILKIDDLKEGMALQGTVRNVVDFGAFVDIGLKNDGLVHISKITKDYIKHPLEKLNVGDIVDVVVIKVDLEKQKIGLSMVE